MATTRILLPLEEAVAPAVNGGLLVKTTSTAAAPANAPLFTANKIVFDPTTDQVMVWTFRVPSDYLSGGSVFTKWGADANTGAVILKAGIGVVVDGTTNMVSGAAYNAADVSATVNVPGTVGLTAETSWALTVTNLVGGRLVSLFIGRRASAAGDTCTALCNLWAAEFEYTS